jgi:ABC-type phosphate transport system substrate-binding protein
MEVIMKRIIVFMILALFMAASIGTTGALAARDYISIVGSSTVYPFPRFWPSN